MSEQEFRAFLPPASLHRLGLLEQPFGDRPHGPAIFEDAAYRTQVNVALNLLQTGERMLLIRGEPGLGKTTFMRKLLDSAQPGLDFEPCVADPDLLFSDIWLEYLGRLDPSTDYGDHIRHTQLVNLIQGMNRRGQRPVLLIDDAHDLADDTSGQLLDFWREMAEAREAFGLVAAVDPGVEGSEEGYLAGTRLDASRTYNITLYPFDLDQTERYLQHRLQLAGGESSLLTRKDVERIYERSGGRPGFINLAARDVLQEKAARGAKGFSLALPRLPGLQALKGVLPAGRARHALAGGVAVVVGGLLVVNLFPGSGDEDAEIVDDELQLELPALTQAEPDADEPESTDHLPMGMTRDEPSEEAPDVPVPDEAEAEPAPEPAPEQIPDVEAEPAPEPELEPAPEPEPEPESEPEPAPEDPAPEEEVSELEPDEPVDAEAAEQSPVQQWLDEAHTWVREQPDGHYTIQVLAAGSPDTVLQYMRQHDLDEQGHLVRTQRQGNDWYLVLVGSHADRDAARDAIEDLPDAVRAAGPWVRSIESVAESMP